MLCKNIIEIIEKNYSPVYAMEWDNVGLLVGNDQKDVKRIYIALDATDEVIDAAIENGADLIVTHHPLIFGGMKKINNQDFLGRRILKLIANDICCYVMHTNYDVCKMADLSGEKMHLEHAEVLEVTCDGETPMGIGKIADAKEEMSLAQCCEEVKTAFSLEHVKVFGNLEQKVRRIAICPGSGKSVIKEALKKHADVLITGDIGHHEGIDSVAQGMAIIDAGHYGVEHIFIADMEQYLKEHIEGVEVFSAPICHPFQIL